MGKSTKSFEGHTGKEPSSAMFHPKSGVQSADGEAQLPPGHPKFGKTPARRGKTTAAFVKTVN